MCNLYHRSLTSTSIVKKSIPKLQIQVQPSLSLSLSRCACYTCSVWCICKGKREGVVLNKLPQAKVVWAQAADPVHQTHFARMNERKIRHKLDQFMIREELTSLSLSLSSEFTSNNPVSLELVKTFPGLPDKQSKISWCIMKNKDYSS